MRLRVLGSSLVLASLLFTGCHHEVATPNFDDMTKGKMTEIKKDIPVVPGSAVVQMMKDKKDFVIVDVREADEIKTFGKVDWKNQKTMSRGKMEYMLAKSGLKVDDNIYVMCKTGGRSTFAAKTLKDYGFKNVTIIDGGFDKWLENKYPALD